MKIKKLDRNWTYRTHETHEKLFQNHILDFSAAEAN